MFAKHGNPKSTPVPAELMVLIRKHQGARALKYRDIGDSLHDKIFKLGWQVIDPKNGSKLESIY